MSDTVTNRHSPDTGHTFAPTITTTTEIAYIEGEVAHCYLEKVGKPIFHAHLKTYYGTFLLLEMKRIVL